MLAQSWQRVYLGSIGVLQSTKTQERVKGVEGSPRDQLLDGSNHEVQKEGIKGKKGDHCSSGRF